MYLKMIFPPFLFFEITVFISGTYFYNHFKKIKKGKNFKIAVKREGFWKINYGHDFTNF